MKKILAVGLLSLLTFFASTSEARRPLDYSALVGVWSNTNPATGNIVRVIIRRVPAGITIQTFGACTPLPCNHGIVHARSFTPGVSSGHASGFNALKNFGFKQMASNGIRVGNTLYLLTQNRFAGGDTRFDYTMVENFSRIAVETPDPTTDEADRADSTSVSTADKQ